MTSDLLCPPSKSLLSLFSLVVCITYTVKRMGSATYSLLICHNFCGEGVGLIPPCPLHNEQHQQVPINSHIHRIPFVGAALHFTPRRSTLDCTGGSTIYHPTTLTHKTPATKQLIYFWNIERMRETNNYYYVVVQQGAIVKIFTSTKFSNIEDRVNHR